ncbi:T cell activation RhoGTPase activating protein a [Astyanax mexicanus]|uniref:T cell activation RhoGTPase activating protein a n=1 Tax=Astyanax mexicanus TaxID=7994 RepID=UPI0020CB670E|nr:T cell activation RhoGTPase activating protein a [Astyanax mexicanus]
MKVLGGHVVTKSQAEDSMELIITPPPTPAVHENSGPPLPQLAFESNLFNPSHAGIENINKNRWRRLFRRVQKKNMVSDCAPDSPQKKLLFARALSDVCGKDGSPPKPIMDILLMLWRKGPLAIGVFRKTGNAKRLREIKEQLNSGTEVDLQNEYVILLADLLKDFLRHLPGCLLMMDQTEAWLKAMEEQDDNDRCTALQLVIKKLPGPNVQLLKHVIAVLYYISLQNEINLMHSHNLAVCVSPNLLQADTMETMEKVTNLTQFLIENCCEIFGEDVLTLLGGLDEEELSDTQDSLHHDSAYDSNDPDADGHKGSYTDMSATHSDSEEKVPIHLQASSCPGAAGRHSTKPFIRRRSEPTIGFNKDAQKLSVLSRSQTEMDFYEQHLTKQISDECILFRTGSRQKTNALASGEPHLQSTPKDSCSSLDSTFSSASESSVNASSPVVSSATQRRALQRKQSFPTRLTSRGGDVFSETPKKRSQSMKVSCSRTKLTFAQGRRVEKVLRHSQTLPEVFPLDRDLFASQRQRRLSSKEVFHKVDSKIPSMPPSYEQAVQDNAHTPLPHRSSLTVEAARCLSKSTCCQSTFPTAETSNSCSEKDGSEVQSCESGENSLIISDTSATCAKTRQRSISETMIEEASNGRMSNCCGRQMLETLNVRESYV